MEVIIMAKANKTFKKKREARRIAETLSDAILMDPSIPDELMEEVLDFLIEELFNFKGVLRAERIDNTENDEF